MYMVTLNGIQKPDESLIATVLDEATGTGYTFYTSVTPGDSGTSLTAKLVDGAVVALASAGIVASSADIIVSPVQRS